MKTTVQVGTAGEKVAGHARALLRALAELVVEKGITRVAALARANEIPVEERENGLGFPSGEAFLNLVAELTGAKP